jgi:hypothetical protein
VRAIVRAIGLKLRPEIGVDTRPHFVSAPGQKVA